MNLIETDIKYLRNKSSKAKLKDVLGLKMFDKMHHILVEEKGLGLSGIQIGYPYRICMIKLVSQKHFLPMINPTIYNAYEVKNFPGEGCLSFPGQTVTTKRYNYVHCEYTDLRGKRVKAVFNGLEAVILQHEIDHMDGIVFTDRRADLVSVPELSAEFPIQRKVSRNSACPCGSGKKYKRCCLKKEQDYV